MKADAKAEPKTGAKTDGITGREIIRKTDRKTPDRKENMTDETTGRKSRNRELTCDDLQNGFTILQPKKGFRFGMDAVLLAYFADISAEDTVLDLGCGSGILPLLLLARGKGSRIVGLEIQEVYAELAKRNMERSHLQDRVTILTGDLKEADFPHPGFDVVISNPPYRLPSRGKVSPDPELAAARHEICCSFPDVAQAAGRALKDEGHFFLIHRAERMEEVLGVLRDTGLFPSYLRRVRPYEDKQVNLILIDSVKGVRTQLTEGPVLTIYEAPGVYTQEVQAIYNFMMRT
ncbi:MAG: methyltransferase domain-containing protein [Eubacterium sp.]|nr:methyltransferase domain-containing protein [Eubacterium sp.]